MSNPFKSLYDRYGWRYKCDGVGDTFAEQIAFKIVGESTLLVLLTQAGVAFWKATAAVIEAQNAAIEVSQETLRQLTKSKEMLCGKLMEQTDSWVDLLKGYITPTRVASETVNNQCYILETAEVKLKKELNSQIGKQFKNVLQYIVGWMKETMQGNILGGTTIAVLYNKITQYRHDLVCLFAAMWHKLWEKVTANRVVCKQISEGNIVGGEPGYKLKL